MANKMTLTQAVTAMGGRFSRSMLMRAVQLKRVPVTRIGWVYMVELSDVQKWWTDQMRKPRYVPTRRK